MYTTIVKCKYAANGFKKIIFLFVKGKMFSISLLVSTYNIEFFLFSCKQNISLSFIYFLFITKRKGKYNIFELKMNRYSDKSQALDVLNL